MYIELLKQKRGDYIMAYQIEVDISLIKKSRLKLGITQQVMAEKLGLEDKSKYSRRESGEYSFKLIELPLLSDILGIPYEKFFKSNVAEIETTQNKKEARK